MGDAVLLTPDRNHVDIGAGGERQQLRCHRALEHDRFDFCASGRDTGIVI